MAYGSYTDYLEMLAAQPQDKLALVDDAASFTYGQLVAEAKKLRSSTTMDARAVFIHELAHFIELNHSKRFYAIVEDMEPEYWWIHREMVVFYRRTSCNAVTV